MINSKCTQCGLVNFALAAECKRCGAALGASAAALGTPGATAWTADEAFAEEAFAEESPAARRSLKRRALAGLGLSALVVFGWYLSLLATSQRATYAEREQVERAVAVIERAGFSRDAFLLRHLTAYRTSDNWWNRATGHAEAYAATNFPFEVVTLYPDFFAYATDDTERAVILLHEARHLGGAGEEEALSTVWRDKWKLGWTREKYGGTRVWKNVNEFTRRYVPKLFRCGPEGQQDCTE